MIASLQGRLIETGPMLAVVESAGVGYEVNLPLSAMERLPAPGGEVRLFTHAVYREDSQALYGFATRRDRDFFRILVGKVSGVGPRLALALMSHLTLATIEDAIREGNAVLLSKCPGIGKKTAERLIVELRDKSGSFSINPPARESIQGTQADERAAESDPTAQVRRDGRDALIALGYSLSEAEKSIDKAIVRLRKENPEAEFKTEDTIRTALGSK